MEISLLIVLLLLVLANLGILYTRLGQQPTADYGPQLQYLSAALQRIEQLLADEGRANRTETQQIAKDNRQELNAQLRSFKDELHQTLHTQALQTQRSHSELVQSLAQSIEALANQQSNLLQAQRSELAQHLQTAANQQNQRADALLATLQQHQLEQQTNQQNAALANEQRAASLAQQAKTDAAALRADTENAFRNFREAFDKHLTDFAALQREKFGQLENRQLDLVKQTENRLEQIRATVEEKLEKTLSERLGQSFETVGKQLIEVQKGLGEMQHLAQDVGGLKRVLSNVKMRGGIGEVQLGMLLEQILAPDQFAANVQTKSGSADHVEYAIKLPGRDDQHGSVWLPIDAKFPKDVYEQLQNAYDTADTAQIEAAQRTLENTIKKMARDISDKYLDPPATTDFGILFLPFEGIYAEVVRKASLLEELQRQYKIIVTGPTTLAAILNSLQMGFRTLAIQKRSSEVWQILGAVKKEFESFGGLMQKAQKNLQQGMNQLDEVMGKRTRAIERRLRSVEVLDELASQQLLGLPAEPDED